MYNLNYAPTTFGYKVEKIICGGSEQKRLNTTELHRLNELFCNSFRRHRPKALTIVGRLTRRVIKFLLLYVGISTYKGVKISANLYLQLTLCPTDLSNCSSNVLHTLLVSLDLIITRQSRW
jgi:hypothetical protein